MKLNKNFLCKLCWEKSQFRENANTHYQGKSEEYVISIGIYIQNNGFKMSMFNVLNGQQQNYESLKFHFNIEKTY